MNPYVYFLYLAVIFFIISFLLLKGISDLISVFSGSPPGESNSVIVKKLFKEIKLKKNTILYDLGCGMGNISYIAANDFGAQVVGVDVSPLAYIISKIRNYNQKNVEILYGNFKKISLENAEIVYCYLFPGILSVLSSKFKQEMQEGSIVISMCFKVPNLKISKILEINKKKIYIYKF